MTKVKLFWLIIIADQLLKRKGFKYVCDYLKTYKQKTAHTNKYMTNGLTEEELIQLCDMIRLNCQKHILRKRALCLHQSVVGFYLLMKKGIDVELCIGASTSTFAAHAWLERNNVVLNDDPQIKVKYELLFKI